MTSCLNKTEHYTNKCTRAVIHAFAPSDWVVVREMGYQVLIHPGRFWKGNGIHCRTAS